jgi:hypothetical protein
MEHLIRPCTKYYCKNYAAVKTAMLSVLPCGIFLSTLALKLTLSTDCQLPSDHDFVIVSSVNLLSPCHSSTLLKFL